MNQEQPPHVETGGGAYIDGGVNTGGGDFVGRDKIIQCATYMEQRAATKAEELGARRDFELKRLAQGVEDYARWLRRQICDAPPSPPFKGLAPYGVADGEALLGRDQAFQAVWSQLLLHNRLLVLHAPPGMGKTSLVQARVVPALLQANHLPLLVRAFDDDPVRAVKRKLLPHLDETPGLANAPLSHFLGRVTEWWAGTQVYVLLDRFGQFFDAHPDPAARQAFAKALAACVEPGRPPVHFVLIMRSGYLGHLSSFHPYVIQPLYAPLLPLSRAQARQAITGPLAGEPCAFEPALVDRLLDDLGPDSIVPSELQLICATLLNRAPADATRITLALYHDTLGGKAGVLNHYLENTLARELTGADRRAADRILEALVTSDGRRDLRPLEDLTHTLSDVDRATVARLLSFLEDKLLVRQETIGPYGQTQAYELTQECLVSQIWIDPQARMRKAAQEMLRGAVELWESSGETLSQQGLAILKPHAQHLNLNSAQDMLMTSALKAGHAVSFWLRQLGQRPADVQRVVTTLTSQDETQRRPIQQGLGQEDLPERLQLALEDRLRHGDSHEQQQAAEVLWPRREAIHPPLRRRLFWVHARHQAAEQARQRRDVLLVAALALVALVVGLFWWNDWRQRQQHRQVLTSAVTRRIQEFPVRVSPVQLFFDGRHLWVAGLPWARRDATNDRILKRPAGLDLLDTTGAPAAYLERFAQEGLSAFAMASDGRYVWATLQKETDGVVQPGFVVKFSLEELLYQGPRQRDAPPSQRVLYQVPVGRTPQALAFDGASLWVANYDDDSVMKLAAETGQVVHTVTQTISAPTALAYDGLYLWVANAQADTLTKLNTADGSVVATVPVGDSPWALAVAGDHLWVANADDGTLTQVDRKTAKKVNSYPVGAGPMSLVHTPAGLFVAAWADNAVVQVDPANGQQLATFEVDRPLGLAFDGAHLWVGSTGNRSVLRLPVSVVPITLGPKAVAADGTHVWAMDYEGNLVQVQIDDRRVVDAFNVYRPRNVPILFGHVLATDGKSVWVNLYDREHKILRVRDGRVRELDTLDPATSRSAMIFDGAHLWAIDGRAIVKLDPDDGSVLARADVAKGTLALTHGGGAIWGLNPGAGTLTKVRARDAEVVGAFPLALGAPVALAYGNDAVWIADRDTDVLVKYWAQDGTPAAEVSLVNLVTAATDGDNRLQRRACQPLSVAYAGQSLWVACREDDTLRQYRARDGQFQSAIDVGEAPLPQALASDGTSLWVAGNQDRTLTRISIDR